ncbi:ATP-binding cassette domain-containing protein [Caldicoprobacter guelmensis]|uniref:ATP-binding cassette domain-containing protein n=1 Tax=Caldicoprobacter guelmensis TaxID=1170224 RepID=UPI00311CD8C9
MKNVEKYIGDKLLFYCESLKFEKKGLYIIKGPNGCGKTTFLKMLFGKDRDFKGVIKNTFDKRVMLPQQPYFFKGSVLYNISLGARDSVLAKACRVMDEFSIDPGASIFSLSLGQRQLVAFLRAFYADADVLFLDEPDTYLDGRVRNFVFELIWQDSNNRCIIAVTHDSTIAVPAITIRFEDCHII